MQSDREPGGFVLGTAIKKATSAVGIKPCRSCEERAEMLNEWSRRGILKTGFLTCLAFFGGFKNSTLKLMWQVAGKEAPASFDEAVAFTQMFIGLQVWFYGQANQHTNSDAIITLMIEHREHFKGLGPEGKAWMRRVKLQEEVLPGWKIDFALASSVGVDAEGKHFLTATEWYFPPPTGS